MHGSLIDGQELYHVGEDPEQRRDLAAEYPDLAIELRHGYEDWWEIVSKQFDEEIPLSIWAVAGETTVLNSHDLRDDVDETAWNQMEIRQGKICVSYWEIQAEHAGFYRFQLYRWPREENRSLRDGFDGEVTDWWSGGEALPIASAELTVGGSTKSVLVEATD